MAPTLLTRADQLAERQAVADAERIDAAAELGSASVSGDSEAYQRAEDRFIVATQRWQAAFLAECREQTGF